MDAKKLLVLETIAATLKVNQNELADWVNNRNQASKVISLLPAKAEIWGTQQLIEAARSLAERSYNNTEDPSHWSGH